MTDEEIERRIVRLLTIITWAWLVPCALVVAIVCVLILKDLLS
jgi:hypothetical protein